MATAWRSWAIWHPAPGANKGLSATQATPLTPPRQNQILGSSAHSACGLSPATHSKAMVNTHSPLRPQHCFILIRATILDGTVPRKKLACAWLWPTPSLRRHLDQRDFEHQQLHCRVQPERPVVSVSDCWQRPRINDSSVVRPHLTTQIAVFKNPQSNVKPHLLSRLAMSAGQRPRPRSGIIPWSVSAPELRLIVPSASS